jgi:hypothetical protein
MFGTILENVVLNERTREIDFDNASITENTRGQIVYYYAASAAWNMRHMRLATAIGRGLSVLAATASAGRSLRSPDFWRGATTPHINRVRRALEWAGVSIYEATVLQP